MLQTFLTKDKSPAEETAPCEVVQLSVALIWDHVHKNLRRNALAGEHTTHASPNGGRSHDE